MKRAALTIALLSALTAGCRTGKDYARPEIAVPTELRGASTPAERSTSVADLGWAQLFDDPALTGLVQRALERNVDAGIAAARVLEAEALVGATRADQFPTVSADVSIATQRQLLGERVLMGRTTRYGGSAIWQIDFWGRFRRATEAARARLVATEWGRRAVTATIVSDVAGAYLSLRTLDRQIEVARQTLTSREESLRLTRVREQGGATSLVDVRQAEQLVFTAGAQIASLQREIAAQEHLIRQLTGDFPGPVDRGTALIVGRRPVVVPAGLPSALLERRPDIQQAEQNLVAANADIGAARAALFPAIALTGSGGVQSVALGALANATTGVWSIGAALAQPIFNGGRLRAGVAAAEARNEEALLQYQGAIQRAFREAADALTGYERRRAFRDQQALLLDAARDARRLAGIRYEGGATSYLEVLDADTRLFSAELALADADLEENQAYVEIYRALGGGWQ